MIYSLSHSFCVSCYDFGCACHVLVELEVLLLPSDGQHLIAVFAIEVVYGMKQRVSALFRVRRSEQSIHAKPEHESRSATTAEGEKEASATRGIESGYFITKIFVSTVA